MCPDKPLKSVHKVSCFLSLQDLMVRKVSLLKAERALEQYKVLAVIGQHMGYSKGRPLAALVAHR